MLPFTNVVRSESNPQSYIMACIKTYFSLSLCLPSLLYYSYITISDVVETEVLCQIIAMQKRKKKMKKWREMDKQ